MEASGSKSMDSEVNFQEHKPEEARTTRSSNHRQKEGQEKKRIHKKLEETEEENARLQRALKEADNRKTEAEEENARLKNALEEADNRKTEAEEENARLQRALKEADNRKTEAEEENARLKSAYEEADKKKTEAEEKITQLKNVLEEADYKKTEAEEKTTRLQRALEKNNRYYSWLAAVLVLVPLCIGLHLAFKEHEINHHVLRLMLVGKTGAGKSASGNTILGEEAFRVEASPASVTTKCMMKNKVLDGRNITIIDTPGVMDTWLISDQTAHDAHECISMSSPDPHVFLLVIRLGRFTMEERNAVKWIQENFGEEALRFTMILFTGGDLLEGKPVEKFISNSYDLQNLVDTCEGRYHVFNNNERSKHDQVKEMFEKVNAILHENMGYFYTKKVHQKVHQALANEVEKKVQSREREIRQEEELNRKRMEDDMKLEERRKINEMASKLRDEQYENKNLKAESERRYSTLFMIIVSAGIFISAVIIVGYIKQ